MQVVYATETVAVDTPDGGSVLVRKGTHWPTTDPLVRAHPHLFADDPRYGLSWTGTPPAEMAQPPVEQTTAAPGEQRATRRQRA